MSSDQPLGFFVFDYAWVLFILFTCIQAFRLKARSSNIVDEHPELQKGYDQLFKGYLFYLNIPWVIIAIGMLFGKVPSTYSFLRPRDGNPFVIAFHLAIVMLWVLGIWWVYFKGGAEFLVKYKGLFNREVTSSFIKFYLGACLLGGVLGMVFMWST